MNMNKECIKCKIIKDINQFYKRTCSKDGHSSSCKDCEKARSKDHYANSDKNKRLEQVYEYRRVNKEKMDAHYKNYRDNKKEKTKEYNKMYRTTNKDMINEYFRERRKNDVFFRLSTSIRNSINHSFRVKSIKKNNKTEVILGCSFIEFKKYLESKFEPWMNWDNRGRYNGDFNYGWDIDHIIPLSTAKNEEDLIKLNHYTNLQPLCSKVNRDIKIDKIYEC